MEFMKSTLVTLATALFASYFDILPFNVIILLTTASIMWEWHKYQEAREEAARKRSREARLHMDPTTAP